MSEQLPTEEQLNRWLKAAMNEYKKTPAYYRNEYYALKFISLSDMATDLAPLLLREMAK